jgi:hypothetical protein
VREKEQEREKGAGPLRKRGRRSALAEQVGGKKVGRKRENHSSNKNYATKYDA